MLLGCGGGASPRTAELPPSKRLYANFERVVFHDEYDPKRSLHRVRKWTGPVRIALFGERSAHYRDTVARHAATIADLTGLAVEIVAGGAPHNFAVHVVPWDEMEAVARPYSPNPDWLATIIESSSCLFLFRRNRSFEIVQATVVVSADEGLEAGRACLLEEMVQALGLPNDSELIRPSVFNEWDGLTRLATSDRILLRTLYDRRIQSGMPRATALAIAGKVIAELRDAVRADGPAALSQR